MNKTLQAKYDATKYDFIKEKVESKIWSLDEAASNAYASAKRLRVKRRIPELEKWIVNSPICALNYARLILRKRWPEAEHNILKNESRHIMSYIESVVKERWPEAEHIIANSPECAYKYARDILRKRWPEAESNMLRIEKNKIQHSTYFFSLYSFKYASDIIQDRWPELENLLLNNPKALKYYAEEVIHDTLPEEIHNRMICYAMSGGEDQECAKQYIEFSEKVKIDLIKKLNKFDQNLTVREIIDLCKNRKNG
jgi:hypothetical protein